MLALAMIYREEKLEAEKNSGFLRKALKGEIYNFDSL